MTFRSLGWRYRPRARPSWPARCQPSGRGPPRAAQVNRVRASRRAASSRAWSYPVLPSRCTSRSSHSSRRTCDCGTTHDRDVNAAKNLLAAGRAVSACGAGARPQRSSPDGQSAKKQEASRREP
ncbi:zinc ribbon domain-containing protein [Streptomyces sp. NBC_00285]|uniref:zinc ribbon domain-containing protein n=1 Tax=Streptomyces sp. NBC_00285 TaxID=2975700 RepID=UPI003FA710E1